MTDKLKQIAEGEIEKLPKEVQSYINSVDWGKITEEIGKKYLLSDSEINDLQVQTLLVLIGLTDLDFFATNIEDEIGTSKNEAEKIADEIIEKIFVPINEKFEENIKKNLNNKNPTPQQNLDFVLSGGDYSAFVDNQNQSSEIPTSKPQTQDLRNQFKL